MWRVDKSISDHNPQLIRFEHEEYKTSLFRFYNVIADHEDFLQIVRENWTGSVDSNLLKDVWIKCKRLKVPLKAINTQFFRNTSENVKMLRTQLQATQLQLCINPGDDTLATREALQLKELEKWSLIEEKIWKQKSRVDWLELGDSNTKFFHAFAQIRQNIKGIHRLVRADGTVCLGQQLIKEEIRKFYVDLMGTAAIELTMVDKMIMRRGPNLTVQQQHMLNAPCSESEVKDALFSMNSHKAPGIDGYNAYFFKKSWSIIGEDVVRAVCQFFHTGHMPSELNVALITLLPKTENAVSAKDFRPIACCTILYKIVSKILANRLKEVLDTVISANQSAFVKGRLILDNIILSHEIVKGYNRKNISPRCVVKVDIQKAFDSVEWPFLHQMLVELGFPYRYIG